MVLQGFACQRPIELLTRGEMEIIHAKSLEILKETGIVLQWEPALKALQNAGCNVNFASKLVQFPKDIVEDTIKSCPNRVHVKARDPKYDLEIGGETVYFAPQASPYLYDQIG